MVTDGPKDGQAGLLSAARLNELIAFRSSGKLLVSEQRELLADAHATRRLLAQALAALELAEWQRYVGGTRSSGWACLVCTADQRDGHLEGCQVGNAIAALRAAGVAEPEASGGHS